MLDEEDYGEECLYCHGGVNYLGEICPFCGDARRAEEAQAPERVALPARTYELPPEGVLERVQF